tara:strand:- start:8907 stop:10481 length:1575 start_codon:yes stop_codon:yes gene_type:complete
MKINKINLLINTIKYLKFKQIFYRIFYSFKFKTFQNFNRSIDSVQTLKFNQFLIHSNFSFSNNSFTFLNRTKKFNKINWNFLDYGKLWNYNLNYFSYLDSIDKKQGLTLINDYIHFYNQNKNNIEPYPTSLRLMNWIKFLSKNNINDSFINDTIASDSEYLYNNIEYHLMGNHILENSFSLLFCSYYLKSEKLYFRSRKILLSQLREQILPDGAHFELSTMYHQILVIRLLDCINLISENKFCDTDNFLLDFLISKASSMIGWLDSISYKNNYVPLLNDSAQCQMYDNQEIINYAKRLGIGKNKLKLNESGYRKWLKGKAEILIDIGQLGASYIPGHAHADTFNFEYFFQSKPIIIDPGISTYEDYNIRNLERSTLFHNTISVDKKSSSEIWDFFKVANRAKIIKLEEKSNFIKASHDGYKKNNIMHTRVFKFISNDFIIEDLIDSHKIKYDLQSSLHFHPDCELSFFDNTIRVNDEIIINLYGHKKLQLKEYEYPVGFNLRVKSKKLVSKIGIKSKITISYEN